jgi:apolipoprotein D and lipocalin family protein
MKAPFFSLALALCFGLPASARAQVVTPVAAFDATQMTGTWYEIARLPNKTEKHCVANATELVALADKPRQLQLVDTCRVAKGYLDPRNHLARANKKTHDGAFHVSTIWPFSRKYWWVVISPANDWSVVGSPNHKQLWIYARRPMLEPADLAAATTRAAAMGFAVGNLIPVTQEAAPSGTTTAQ